MSYILDALRKAERERKRITTPDVLTLQDVQVSGRRKGLTRRYLLAFILLLAAALFIWRPGLLRSKKPVIVEQPAKQQYPAQARTVSPDVPSNLSNNKTIIDQDAPLSSLVIDRVSEAKNVPVNAKAAEEVGVIPLPQAELQSTEVPAAESRQVQKNQLSPETTASVNITPLLENKIYSLSELPSSIQQNLPAFSISTHIHSADPSSRMVRINGQTLREGQELVAGLKIEEITSDGVVFRYQNIRFRIGLR